jgi:hypothetical protein
MDDQFFSLGMLITGRYQEQPFRSYMDAIAECIADHELPLPAPFAPMFPRY